MKILRKGILPQNIIYTGSCRRCNAQVECNYTEVTRRDLGDRYSGEFIECSVPCPTKGCGYTIILIEKPTPASEMDKVFEELFGNNPKPPTEHFKIVIPSNVQKKIAEEQAKKGRCDCGVHRISEIRRRAKASAENLLKAMDTREKTLSDWADDL